jgi:carbon monoxide dehydrogenase subunit G
MLISQTIVVDQPIDDVWKFFDDIPQLAACIPGADLTDKLGTDHYGGDVIISAGPVKLEFAGQAKVASRDNAKKIITLDASGSDKKGRGEAQAILVAALNPVAQGNIAAPDLLQAGYHIGLDTIGQTLRNANLQERSDPIIPKAAVGPWNQSTIDPDLGRVPLEVGCGAR